MTTTLTFRAPWGVMAGMPTNVLDGAGLRVARCDFDGDFDNPQARANATLIAAAPDLYAALEFVRKYAVMRASKGDALPAQLTSAVNAALAKAEGA